MKYREYLDDKKYALLDYFGNRFFLKYYFEEALEYQKLLPKFIGIEGFESGEISDIKATKIIRTNLTVYYNILERLDELVDMFNKYKGEMIIVDEGSVMEFSDPLQAVFTWIEKNLSMFPEMGKEVFDEIDSKERESMKEFQVLSHTQYFILDTWFRRELEWDRDKIKEMIGKSMDTSSKKILLSDEDYFLSKVYQLYEDLLPRSSNVSVHTNKNIPHNSLSKSEINKIFALEEQKLTKKIFTLDKQILTQKSILLEKQIKTLTEKAIIEAKNTESNVKEVEEPTPNDDDKPSSQEIYIADVNAEIRNARKIIKKKDMKIEALQLLSAKPTNPGMKNLIDGNRFKSNDKANCSAIGEKLGKDGQTIKAWIKQLGLSDYAFNPNHLK
ncbi:MAG: hypothetical protein HOK35_18295 [Cytophagia bacterium]|jgi:hypothetical protein|nr:hypothetical protein [Cytophagia bacterium]